MVHMEDLLDKLYSLGSSNWCDNVTSLLTTLNYPVDMYYRCSWEKFISENHGGLRYITTLDRKILSGCGEIITYKVLPPFHKLSIFAINLDNSSRKMRNEYVFDVTRIITALRGYNVIIVFLNNEEIAFSGTYNHSEVFISEWFGYTRDYQVNEKLLDIDFSYFASDTLSEIYYDYLWGIARPYVKFKESKEFLTYGCDAMVADDYLVYNAGEDEPILVHKVDYDETFQLNSQYYKELYGIDYFIDEGYSEYEKEIVHFDEDESELEWSMLEFELKDEMLDDNAVDYDNNDEWSSRDEDNQYNSVNISQLMNPEQMLRMIQQR